MRNGDAIDLRTSSPHAEERGFTARLEACGSKDGYRDGSTGRVSCGPRLILRDAVLRTAPQHEVLRRATSELVR